MSETEQHCCSIRKGDRIRSSHPQSPAPEPRRPLPRRGSSFGRCTGMQCFPLSGCPVQAQSDPWLRLILRTWTPSLSRPVIVRWRVIARRVIARRRVIGLRVIGLRVIRLRVIAAVVEGRRTGERPDRRGDDHCGGAEDSAYHAERPLKWERRARGIVLSLGGRDW